MPRKLILSSILVFLILSCALPSAALEDETTIVRTTPLSTDSGDRVASSSPERQEPADPTNLVQPDNLTYQGAFLLPPGDANSNWAYSGYAMTYFPAGNPEGPKDGFPGSLFAVGHDHQQMVSEISIPVPVISTDPSDLNTAVTLQPFADITGGMFGELEIPRAGIAYLPPMGEQTTSKLYFSWGQHFQFEKTPSHGWAELDLANSDPAGPWLIGEYTNYVLNDYMFEIPEDWAAANAPGYHLATGRFRDGVWSGLGPALFAIAPWMEGNPPASGTRLNTVLPLLLYGNNIPGNPEIDISNGYQMVGFAEPDEWSGGSWLTTGERSALVFVGTKATGSSWYGFSNAVEYPTSGDPNEEYPEVPVWPHDDRGWWSENIRAQIIFFNPDDLAAVARGQMETWEPQPFAALDITEFLFNPGFDYENYKRYLLGAIAFDRRNGLIYIIERQAVFEGESVIHVFKITD